MATPEAIARASCRVLLNPLHVTRQLLAIPAETIGGAVACRLQEIGGVDGTDRIHGKSGAQLEREVETNLKGEE